MATKKKVTKKKITKKAPVKKVPIKKVAKRKVAKKKVTKRKSSRGIKEEQFDISLKSDNFNVPDKEETVQADDIGDMIDDAEGDYDTIKINKAQTLGSKPTTAPDSALITNKPDGLGESFDISKYKFPYSISLPAGYEKLVKFSLKESANHRIINSGNRFTVRLNEEQLEILVHRLKLQSDNPLARNIIDGIIRSAK